jgi:hypothetical protein
LLSHYLDVPVGDLMRDRGIVLGPRPRSRWEQLNELESRAAEIRARFHRDLARVWGEDKRRFFRNLQLAEDRVDTIYGDDISAKYFPEDMVPYQMEKIVNDLEGFYQGMIADQRRLREMVDGL